MESSKVDILFETNSIAEIEEIQKKLKNDVETKKDDLKQIVGERYRDLIDASDTIQEMRHSCSEILLYINQLNAFCEKFSFGKSRITKATLDNSNNLQRYNECSIPIKMKLILKTPTAIWLSLDTGNVLKAVFFYFQAKNVHKSLSNSKIPKIINDYISAIDNFEAVLLDRCWRNLQNLSEEDINENDIALHFNCILLLQNLSISSLYEAFVHRQITALLSSFQSKENVELQFCVFFKILFRCLRTTFLVFFDNSGAKSLIVRNMNSINKAYFTHTFVMNQRTELLPDEIVKFRLKPSENLQDIEPTRINYIVKKFIDSAKQEGTLKILDVLMNVSSASEVFNILSKVDAFFTECDRYSQWDEFCDTLLSFDYSIWQTFLRAPVMQTLKSLFETKLKEAFDVSIAKVSSVSASDVSNFNLSANIWMSDLNGNNDLQSKAFGISSLLKIFCDEFDHNMQFILKDCQIIINGTTRPKMINERDESELRSHFHDVSQRLLLDFSSKLKEMIQTTSDRNILAFLSHLCRSLTQCCPNLKACFGNERNNEKWETTKNDLIEVSQFGFKLYFQHTIQRLFQIFEAELNFVSVHVFIDNFLIWEEASFDETTEDGKTVSSTLRIPSHLSLPLYKFLNSFVHESNAVVAHTMFKKVIFRCLTDISKELSQLYHQKLNEIKSSETLQAIKQTIALQLYFDLLYWKQLLVNTREDTIKKEAVPIIQQTATICESIIDPFDLHVFLPKLQENVVSMVKRCSLLFGLLLPEPPTTALITVKSRDNVTNETHNLMPTHVLSNSFQLLPLPKFKR